MQSLASFNVYFEFFLFSKWNLRICAAYSYTERSKGQIDRFVCFLSFLNLIVVLADVCVCVLMITFTIFAALCILLRHEWACERERARVAKWRDLSVIESLSVETRLWTQFNEVKIWIFESDAKQIEKKICNNLSFNINAFNRSSSPTMNQLCLI